MAPVRSRHLIADGESEDGSPIFNHPFDPNNLQEITTFKEGVEANANQAPGYRLRPNYDFGGQVVTFDKHTKAAEGRALPLFAQSDEDQTFRLKLTKVVKRSHDPDEEERLCQIWEAHVESTAVPANPLERVLLKIYQQSAMALPRVDPNESRPLRDFYNRRGLAGGEALAYEKLRGIQGLAVPYMFGLFELNMHNDEKAYVLVLEYIEGFTLHELSTAYSEEDPEHDGATAAWGRHLELYEKVFPICFASLKTIHDCGLGHNKMHPCNIIITPPVQRLKDPAVGIVAGHFNAVIVNFRCFNLLEEKRGQRLNEETKEMDRARIGAYLGGCCDSHFKITEEALDKFAT
ncbi:hypothetical protein BDZ89DRAFT_1162390 [Hymenopellis radicata]|nr:hypothetical protein BDZ89DRAFT_1162390 [Hymenopellis radicata]